MTKVIIVPDSTLGSLREEIDDFLKVKYHSGSTAINPAYGNIDFHDDSIYIADHVSNQHAKEAANEVGGTLVDDESPGLLTYIISLVIGYSFVSTGLGNFEFLGAVASLRFIIIGISFISVIVDVVQPKYKKHHFWLNVLIGIINLFWTVLEL